MNVSRAEIAIQLIPVYNKERIGDKITVLHLKGRRLVAMSDMANYKLSSRSTLRRMIDAGAISAYYENGQPRPLSDKSNKPVFINIDDWLNIDHTKTKY